MPSVRVNTVPGTMSEIIGLLLIWFGLATPTTVIIKYAAEKTWPQAWRISAATVGLMLLCFLIMIWGIRMVLI